MSDTTIANYPREWYRFTKMSFQLRSSSLTAARPWVGGNSVYGPHAQVWMPKFTTESIDEQVWPDIAAFFDELGGQSGILRIGDPSRVLCRYNRELIVSSQSFSDGTYYSDGTGNLDGAMPSLAHLIAPARRGDTFVKIGGLLPSIAGALRRGDLIEFRPGGIADAMPRLHSVTLQGNTNSDGECGVRISPPLRADIASGDQVVTECATSIFRMIDDTQAEMEVSPPLFVNFGMSLIEAIDLA